jgi:tetratricopeptide (TPR) repeat protein
VLAQALMNTRRFDEALAATDRWIAVAPGNPYAYEMKAMVLVAKGDLTAARAIIQAPPATVPLTRFVSWVATYNEMYWLLSDEQRSLLLRLPPSEFDDDRGSWGLSIAGVARLKGDEAMARTYGDSARIALEEQLRGAPEDGQLHVLYGVALAYVGRKADAIREGQRGVALRPPSADALNHPYMRHQLARIYTLIGEPDRAIDILESLLKIQYVLTPAWLKADPTWDPLRGHPRFDRLVGAGSA